MGAVLFQERADGGRNIVAYSSAKFDRAEAKYDYNEQECLAIIWAIKLYRPYLEDRRFTLRTDSKVLTWMDRLKDTRAKLTRWALLLQEFDFDVEHCPGRDNELPDALSRNPQNKGELDDQERLLPPDIAAGNEVDSSPAVYLADEPELLATIRNSNAYMQFYN